MFKGIDFNELQNALCVQDIPEDINCEALKNYIGELYSCATENTDVSKQISVCKDYVHAHIKHMQAHGCGDHEIIPVYVALVCVQDQYLFLRLMHNLIDMMWC